MPRKASATAKLPGDRPMDGPRAEDLDRVQSEGQATKADDAELGFVRNAPQREGLKKSDLPREEAKLRVGFDDVGTRRITAGEMRRAVQMRAEGADNAAIGEELGIHPDSVDGVVATAQTLDQDTAGDYAPSSGGLYNTGTARVPLVETKVVETDRGVEAVSLPPGSEPVNFEPGTGRNLNDAVATPPLGGGLRQDAVQASQGATPSPAMREARGSEADRARGSEG